MLSPGILPIIPAPAATAYGWHLRSLLRALADAGGHLLLEHEQRLIRCQEALSDAGMDRLCRWLQRVGNPSDDGFTSKDPEVLVYGGWARAEGEALRLCRRAKELVAWAVAVADQGRQRDLSLPVTCGLDGRPLPPLPLSRLWAGVGFGGLRLPWADRPSLNAWLEAAAERARPADESAWLRALARVSALPGDGCSLLGYHLQADYHWCRRLCEVTDALPYDPRRSLSALRALRPVAMAPSLARWQASRLLQLLPLASQRRSLALEVQAWSIWHPGEADRWALRARGERRARAWPDVPSRKIAAWIDHDAQGGVVADGLRVEMCALRHLLREGWQGVHAEGSWWLGLSVLLAAPLICASPAACWAGPWSSLPMDWGRWGFIGRRQPEVSALLQRLVRDAPALCEEALQHWVDLQFPQWPSFPEAEVARVVCARMPGLVLARMVERLLQSPRSAAGLPDLLCWRGDELALWEVKSPGDALSDQQRFWLCWLQMEGVHAGVLRVEAQVHRQTHLLDPGGSLQIPGLSSAPARPAPQQRGRPRKRRSEFPQLELLDADGRVWTSQSGAPVPGIADCTWSQTPGLHVVHWTGFCGAGAVNGWQRPVDRIEQLPLYALRWQGAGCVPQQWLRLPKGWGLPLLIHYEAHSEGGLRAVATALWRRGGWLCDVQLASHEPVVEALQDLRQATSGDGYDWEPHPRQAPDRPLIQAQGEGYGEELAQQLTLVNHLPHALESLGDGVAIALPEDASCLWVSTHPRIRRSRLPWQAAAGPAR